MNAPNSSCPSPIPNGEVRRESVDDYLSLLDWSGRQLHRTTRGQIPEECEPILARLHLSPHFWLYSVEHFRQRFRNEAGPPATRQSYREQRTVTVAPPAT